MHSPGPCRKTFAELAARGIVDPRLHSYRKAMEGQLPNTDTVLA